MYTNSDWKTVGLAFETMAPLVMSSSQILSTCFMSIIIVFNNLPTTSYAQYTPLNVSTSLDLTLPRDNAGHLYPMLINVSPLKYQQLFTFTIRTNKPQSSHDSFANEFSVNHVQDFTFSNIALLLSTVGSLLLVELMLHP